MNLSPEEIEKFVTVTKHAREIYTYTTMLTALKDDEIEHKKTLVKKIVFHHNQLKMVDINFLLEV